MEAVSQTNNARPGTSIAQTTDAGGDDSADRGALAAAASDFETFLTLLTAQMRNQDPLSPLDSTQFVEQLASFSAVEQQIQTNDKLDSLTNSLATSNLESATQWVGKEITTQSGDINYVGEPVDLTIPEGPSGTANLVIRDSNGTIVANQAVTPGERMAFGGVQEEGLAIGRYQASVEFSDGEEVTQTKEPLLATKVVEARLENQDVALVLEGGAKIAPEQIVGVRAAQSEQVTQADLVSDNDQPLENGAQS